MVADPDVNRPLQVYSFEVLLASGEVLSTSPLALRMLCQSQAPGETLELAFAPQPSFKAWRVTLFNWQFTGEATATGLDLASLTSETSRFGAYPLGSRP